VEDSDGKSGIEDDYALSRIPHNCDRKNKPMIPN
jgi:hypothetical protein